MGKPLDREIQYSQIIASHLYQSGDSFDAPVISSLLKVSVSQARDLLNNLTVQGRLVKFHQRQRKGTSREGRTVYQRPPPLLLRKPWRLKTNQQLAIRPSDRLGTPQ